MPRRKVRRTDAPPRARLLTPDVEARLIDASRAGLAVDLAAVNAGVSRATFLRWMAYGRTEAVDRSAGKDPDPELDVFVEFFEKVERARAAAALSAALDIRRASRGGIVTTHRTFDPHSGKVLEETITTPPDWRAAAWYLERQHRKQYGKEDHLEVELTGAAGGPVAVEHTGPAADLATRLAETLHALQYPDEDDQVPDLE
ncbi:hypothetical protein OHS33_38575 (plasmid) [Streptomyces sp. NBC_00536]|uniref:hypothetical protein n=1 Tax=Streptomyces sp. NBC_00536 TaxID=2975769 RepID=UPI002E81127D|nr:hypothetical protein [Streptomyces sp. NBC_00536]WUC84409.1 hypothetical protein OHS33_38575 [Streptomyces sp. NBC_00536]